MDIRHAGQRGPLYTLVLPKSMPSTLFSVGPFPDHSPFSPRRPRHHDAKIPTLIRPDITIDRPLQPLDQPSLVLSACFDDPQVNLFDTILSDN